MHNQGQCGNNTINPNMTDMAIYLNMITYYVKAYVETSVFAMGIVTNIVIFIVLTNMKMGDIMKILLLAVTITDFLASVFGFTWVLKEATRFKGNVPYGHYSTGLLEIFILYKIFILFLGMSSANVIITSAVRTYVLLNPLRSRATITQRYVMKCIVITLITCIVVYSPSFTYAIWKTCFCDRLKPVCQSFFRIVPFADKVRLYFSACVILVGPGTVLANIVCFSLLKHAINKSAKTVGDIATPFGGNSSQPTHSRKNLRINRIIMYVLLFNSVCIFPSCIQVMFLVVNARKLLFDNTNCTALFVDLVSEISLGFLPCYNFWTYMMHNRDFRLRFKQLFFRQDLHYVTPNQTPNRTPNHNTPNMTPNVNRKMSSP